MSRVDLLPDTGSATFARMLRVSGRIGTLRITKSSRRIIAPNYINYYPTRCTFAPDRCRQADCGVYSNDIAVLDTLADIPFEHSGVITRLSWITWIDKSGRRGDFGEHRKITGALIVSEVSGKDNVYRRTSWLEAEDADFFEQAGMTVFLN